MLLRKSYYNLKPFLPRALRVGVRRVVANRLKSRFAGSWPINELAGRTPESWPGWPDGKKFAFVLTHDVEGQKGLNRCRQLADLELRLGFRSSFNFVPEGEYQVPKSLRDFLSARGFEVGVHDLRHDGKLYGSPQKFATNAERINKYLADWDAVGFRSGSMLHNLDWLGRLNIQYDASTFDTDPFEPQPDGVNTIFPFWVPRHDRSGYVELPYTLPQDSTVFLLFGESTIDTWRRKLDWVAEHGGMALLDSHPDYMNFDNAPDSSEYQIDLYERFLTYVTEKFGKEAWFALPREIANHVNHHRSNQPALRSLSPSPAEDDRPARTGTTNLQGRRVAMVMFSYHPADPRPRRAAEALVSAGAHVEMICLRENGDAKREVINGIDIRRVPISRKRAGILEYVYEYSAFILVSSAILAYRSLTRRYDLVYIHNMPDVLVLSGLLPKILGAKVILDLHDPMPELMMTIFGMQQDAKTVRLLKMLEKWSIALTDSIVTVNRACAKLFASRSCSPHKITVVMNSPDERIFRSASTSTEKPAPSKAKAFVVMYHGSLVERNGLDLAVEAFARVHRSLPNAELRVYGSRNAFLERVMETVRNQGLEGAVQYMGPQPLEKIAEAINECDVGIIPNQRSIFTELNTPTRIFEYLAIGKPVIAPRAAGISDYFEEDSLIFFDLGNAEDLAQKIEYVFYHPVEVARIVAAGQSVHQAHTWRQERLTLTGLVSDVLPIADSLPRLKEARRIDQTA